MFVFRVWSVRYNHFHDQLVLSSSSDSRVVLNNIVSLSSEPYGHLLCLFSGYGQYVTITSMISWYYHLVVIAGWY